MTDETKDSPQDAVSAGKAAGGSGTATGLEALHRAGEDLGRATSSAHEDTIEGAHPDFQGGGAEPVGKQAEPATFVANGALGVDMVGSPSGPVPVSSIATSKEHAEELVAARDKSVADAYNSTSSGQKISDEKLSRMSAGEIRAVAHDRGYDISHAAGGRSLRALFKKAQASDGDLEEPTSDE